MYRDTGITATEIFYFVDEFDNLDKRLRELQLSTELEMYHSLFLDYDNLEINLNRILKEESPYFNVFSILNIRHYETKVHTPFLSNLLNPSECHGQGDIFLRLLLVNVLGICNEDDVIENVAVYEELSMKYGRLDIVVTYEVNRNQKTLVIENKVYHHDGDDQLKRYYEYLTVERNLKSDEYILVYLTIHKSQPSSKSIPQELYYQLRASGNIHCLGYKQDIIPWLKSSIKEVPSNRVNDLLTQYIETIKTL